jgi:hypothetical protein
MWHTYAHIAQNGTLVNHQKQKTQKINSSGFSHSLSVYI